MLPLICLTLALTISVARAEDGEKSLSAAGIQAQISVNKFGQRRREEPARTEAPTAETIASMSADELIRIGQEYRFFGLYMKPQYRADLGKNPDDDKHWIDMLFNGERIGSVPLGVWEAYWKRAEILFVPPGALDRLKAKNVSVLSYADRGFYDSSWSLLSYAGAVIDPKGYGEGVGRIAKHLEKYPPGFFRNHLVIELYGSARMLTMECGTAVPTPSWRPGDDRLASFCPNDFEKNLDHEIAHLVLPPHKAETIVGLIYPDGLQLGQNHIQGGRATTPEQQESFLPNCALQDWGDKDPQGKWNAAEDLATIVENLECGRRDQVLALAGRNSFLRLKIKAVSDAYAERGFDVSAWRP